MPEPDLVTRQFTIVSEKLKLPHHDSRLRLDMYFLGGAVWEAFYVRRRHAMSYVCINDSRQQY